MFCRIVVPLLIVFYLIALGYHLVGTFGLFGVEPGPLAGVLLIAFGLPWIWAAGWLPDAALPIATIFAPLITIALSALLCRWSAARARDGQAR